MPNEWDSEKVGKDINWSDANVPEIIRAIYLLKEYRCDVAHPIEISLEEAKQKLKFIARDLSFKQHRMVTSLILELNEKIGLPYPYKKPSPTKKQS